MDGVAYPNALAVEVLMLNPGPLEERNIFVAMICFCNNLVLGTQRDLVLQKTRNVVAVVGP